MVGFCKYGTEPYLYKMRTMSLLGEEMLASEKGQCSMALVGF